MWYIQAIENRMSEEDKRNLAKIYAPVVVGVQNDESRTGLCVMPDGEIRHYGEKEKDHPWSIGEPCYMASGDGGLTWKSYDYAEEAMGSCAYIPELGKYYAVVSSYKAEKNKAMGREYREGTYIMISEKGPEDTEYIERKLSDKWCFCEFMPKYIKAKKRLAVTMQIVTDGNYHPVFFYSDDAGENWTEVILNSTPKYEPMYPSVAPRWENNGSEPIFTELSDGRLMLIARTSHDYFYVYYSEDYGATWSDGEPSDFHGTLTTPYFLELSDGRLLFFWNNTQPLPETNHANELPPHKQGFVRGGEGAFTNRDISHVAVSEDGTHWKGFRELLLNTVRNRPDFRTIGGMRSGADKSVHQFQAMELPFGKVLVAVGQNLASRRLVIFDPNWLLEQERSEDFREGLDHVTTHVYVKSLSGSFVRRNHPGHCAWNRTNGALLVPNPDMDGSEALQICRTQDPRLVSDRQGVVWNFPCAQKGTVYITMRIEGEGVKVALCDHWFNTIDEYVGEMSPFSFKITPDILERGRWCEVKIEFDVPAGMAYVFLDDRKVFGVRMKMEPKYGISYLYLQTDAESADYEGTLIKKMSMVGKED